MKNSFINNNTTSKDDIQLDIHRIFHIIRRYWYLLVFIPILCIGLAVLFSRYLVNQYLVTSTILIKKDENQQSSKSNIAFDPSSLFNGNANNTADEIEILKSQTIMNEVLKELKINPVIYAKGRLKNAQYYKDSPIVLDSFILSERANYSNENFAIEIDFMDQDHFEAKRGDEKVVGKCNTPFYLDSTFLLIKRIKVDKIQKSFILNIRNNDKITKDFSNNLTVLPIKGVSGTGVSNVISISLEDELPKRGVDILNKLIEVYIKFGKQDKNSGDENALNFIDNRVNSLTQEVALGDRNIEQFKRGNGIIADGTGSINYTLSKLGNSDAKITELEIRKAVFATISKTILDQNNSKDFKLLPANLLDNNSSITLQIIEYNKLVLERLRLLKFAKTVNPAVILLENQILETRNVIQENLDSTLRNLQQEIAISLSKFKLENSKADSELRKTPSKERGLLEISRLKNLKESIYLFLLQKREETALSLASTVPNAKVLDPPKSSLIPLKPNKKQIYLMALLVGLIIPIIIMYIIILLNDKIETDEDILSNTTVPFLGYLTMNREINKQIIVEKGSKNNTVETFRLLRSNLQFVMASNKDKTLMVTSSMSGEGKSFVTLNLGVSMALLGKKTIILGFDLRKPKLTQYLENKSDKGDNEGITNFLIGDIKLENIIHKSEVNPLLYYISSGPIPPNPAELIMNEKNDLLFEYLNEHFDFIIIDTPPVGLVVDGLLLSKYAACTLYVTRFGKTKKAQLKIIDNFYKENKLPKPNIVLNAVKTGGRYGYGYGYGYGYDSYEEVIEVGFFRKLYNKLFSKKA
jgi:tyrosine-protein kinase Etk/Wzc